MQMIKSWVIRRLPVAVLHVLLLPAVASGETPPAEWTTLQHDSLRSGYSPVRVEPPWLEIWHWADGDYYLPGDTNLPVNVSTWMSKRMQPVTDGTLVFVGSISDNHLYAIDLKTGRTAWKYDAGAPMVEAATAAGGSVYVADTLGKVHCVDVRSGEARWVFEDPHRGSFMSCPAVDAGVVVIGSRSGHLFGLDANTGAMKWDFETTASFYNSPAVYGGHAYIADEGAYAYKVRLTDGKLRWMHRMRGWSFRHGAPVIVPKHNVVIWRNVPVGDHMAGTVLDGALNLDPKNMDGHVSEKDMADMQERTKGMEEGEGEYVKAQYAARALMEERPEIRTTFAVDMDAGEEPLIIPAGYVSQHADTCSPPVAFPDGRMIFVYRGRFSSTKGVIFSSKYMIDTAWFDFDSRLFKRFGPRNSIESAFGIRGDDIARLSVGKDILYGNWNNTAGRREPGTGGLDLNTNTRYFLGNIGMVGNEFAEISRRLGKTSELGSTGGSHAAVAITANGTLLVNRHGFGISAAATAAPLDISRVWVTDGTTGGPGTDGRIPNWNKGWRPLPVTGGKTTLAFKEQAGVALVVFKLESQRQLNAWLHLESEDNLRLWHNGKLVLGIQKDRTQTVEDKQQVLVLNEGTNEITVEVPVAGDDVQLGLKLFVPANASGAIAVSKNR